MADARKNFAVSTVLTPPSPQASGTTLVAAAAHGGRFPTPPFNSVVCPADVRPSPANAEIVRVTDITDDTFTIVRAQEGSLARTVAVGDLIYAGPTDKTFDDLDAAIALKADAAALTAHTGNTSNPHSVTKSQVGLGSVDNTSDAGKPVSTAQQTALDLKQNAATVAADSGVTAHLADGSDAHDASAISFAPAGSVAATDVQAAVAELDTEKQPIDSDLTSIAGLSPSNDDVVQRKSGVWVARSMAQVKTDLALTKGDVGLGSVDNTADTAKPISTAQQAALDALDGRLDPVESRSPALADGQVVRKEGGVYVARDLAFHTTWTPADNKLLAANFDPVSADTAVLATAGYIVLAKIWVPQTITVTNLLLNIQTAGATLTSGQNLAGIYTSGGTLIAKTASQHASWNSTGIKVMALTAESGQSLTIAGDDDNYIFAAMLNKGTTAAKPSGGGAPAGTPLNAGMVVGDGFRSFYIGDGSATALPSTFTGGVAFPGPVWFGLN